MQQLLKENMGKNGAGRRRSENEPRSRLLTRASMFALAQTGERAAVTRVPRYFNLNEGPS